MKIRNFTSRYIPEPNSGCWLWTGRLSSSGYGRVRVDGKDVMAHRVSFEMHFGSIEKEKIIMHKCNNPICVNPSHLQQGTIKENTRYMMYCGRSRFKGLMPGESTNPIIDGKKRCTKCNRMVESSGFRKRPDTKIGLMSWCKECKALSEKGRVRNR